MSGKYGLVYSISIQPITCTKSLIYSFACDESAATVGGNMTSTLASMLRRRLRSSSPRLAGALLAAVGRLLSALGSGPTASWGSSNVECRVCGRGAADTLLADGSCESKDLISGTSSHVTAEHITRGGSRCAGGQQLRKHSQSAFLNAHAVAYLSTCLHTT